MVMLRLPIPLEHGAQDAWGAETHPLLHLVATYGPWVLGVGTALVVLRALLRSHRYRAVKVLDPEAQTSVNDAIRAAEKGTLGEVVPVVLERSDDHVGARWRCALFALLVGSALLESFLPWSIPEQLLACQLALGALGYGLARLLPDLERIFVSESLASEAAEEQAVQEFHRHGLRETKSRTGVLIFVSLFERRVVVLGDEGIHTKAGDDLWKRTRDAILDGVAKDRLADGIVQGVRACGEVLAVHDPSDGSDPNEVEDRLIVRSR
jgi:putative membrane protein